MSPRKQRGFGIVAAIVILVIFAALAGFIATLSTNQQTGGALDVQGTQGYFAAGAGIEWAKYQTLAASCAPATTLAVGTFTVVVNCSVANSGSAIEAGLGSIYSLTATACNQATCPDANPGPLYVERKLTALIERP